MKRIKIIGLALVAVFAISAVAVASASAAEPEFVWSGTTGKFTAASEGTTKSILQTVGGSKVECSSNTATGTLKASPTKEAEKVFINFKGCTSALGECQSGAVKGEVETKEGMATLGYLNKAATPHQVGLNVQVAGGGAVNLIAEFKCGLVTVKVRNAAIGEISPINAKVKHGCKATKTCLKLIYTEAAGKQKFTKFEGGAVEHLESSFGGAFEESAEEAHDEVEPEAANGEVEIKA
jgi:hypothetical protein